MNKEINYLQGGERRVVLPPRRNVRSVYVLNVGVELFFVEVESVNSQGAYLGSIPIPATCFL